MKASLSSCVVLLLLALALLARCCSERQNLEAELTQCTDSLERCLAERPVSEPQMVVEGRSLGDWIQFSNLPEEEEPDSDEVTYRPAVLFQFGNYPDPDPDYYFEAIWIYKSGVSAPAVYKKKAEGTPLSWINVVADYADRPDPPLEPKDIFSLYPDNGLAGSCEHGPCERNRTIHGSMENVQAVLTYWPGADGYAMTAAQPKDGSGEIRDPWLGNRYEFTFRDPFRVEVYTPEFPDVGEPVVYAVGTVDSIVVKMKAKTDPEKDEMQEPPWPRP